ncbi:PREDICTED: nucleoside diphosphate kinase 3 isoform X1 [Cercocebus atys]|uniref:nucleoside diphosphate kinase 3 isoform X1 n=1 Tax=Cercocebus atys TaxID=9531 RepID=UPI0005F430B4|nr:PREDICTED: nucleoside diphosphate kinase 3 isoform X1 [Cercocebus atys]
MICLVLTIFANLFPAACTGAHERTFLAVKPDGVQRRLVGEIVRRFERKGFKLVALKLVQVGARPPRSCCASTTPSCVNARSTAAWSSTWPLGRWWPWYGRGWTWCAPRGRSSGPRTRPTPRPALSAGISASRNLIHGSDSVESARREIALWFRADELLCWEDSAGHWLYE